jgi:hypothetical protein
MSFMRFSMSHSINVNLAKDSIYKILINIYSVNEVYSKKETYFFKKKDKNNLQFKIERKQRQDWSILSPVLS